MKLKTQIIYLQLISLTWLAQTGCDDRHAVKNYRTGITSQEAIPLPEDQPAITTQEVVDMETEEMSGGTVSAIFSISQGQTQMLSAGEESTIAGSKLAIPSGSLIIESVIMLEEASPLVDDTLLAELDVPDDLDAEAAGPAVMVSSENGSDAKEPFVLYLPLNGEQASLSLADDVDEPKEHVIVFYHVYKEELGLPTLGVVPDSNVTVEEEQVVVKTKFFGTYQASRVKKKMEGQIPEKTVEDPPCLHSGLEWIPRDWTHVPSKV